MKQYTSTTAYKAYADIIYPLDRAVAMYTSHYKTLLSCLQRVKEQGFYNENGLLQTDVLLMDALTGLQGYLSVQFSLFDQLKKHAYKQPAQNELLDAYTRFMDLEITEFFKVFNNNILHGVNFSTVLQFHSGRDEAKLVYYVCELLKVGQWQKSKDYISSFGEFITIEGLMAEYHSHVCAFLDGYEAVLFKDNIGVFKDVLARLGSYAIQYDQIGQKGYLPISQDYLRKKRRFIPEGFS
ncbi:hypothetical protein GXP67_05870 [Rhodocytophaga rosea]|uniref:Uncharacterized protein n=1 Tax=Rhodocytophaga rosea TaxID=2704465 RepID=A0A6C0GEM2_9BACT|nr:hypothetical protein [Rhodocytophaga rosea]QHT66223.1 hypothetical protein GXP67_05870 [Rhodocytophaga rosea]